MVNKGIWSRDVDVFEFWIRQGAEISLVDKSAVFENLEDLLSVVWGDQSVRGVFDWRTKDWSGPCGFVSFIRNFTEFAISALLIRKRVAKVLLELPLLIKSSPANVIISSASITISLKWLSGRRSGGGVF